MRLSPQHSHPLRHQREKRSAIAVEWQEGDERPRADTYLIGIELDFKWDIWRGEKDEDQVPAMEYPFFASASAIASPIPREPPVTTAYGLSSCNRRGHEEKRRDLWFTTTEGWLCVTEKNITFIPSPFQKSSSCAGCDAGKYKLWRSLSPCLH